MQPLPALPRTVFNDRLYTRILTLWFQNIPLAVKAPTPALSSRWFGVNASKESKAAFDAECRSVASDALEHLSPARYPLPPWKSFEEDRANAVGLSAGLRDAVWRDDNASEFEAEHQREEKVEKVEPADRARSLVLLLDQLTRNSLRDLKEQGRVYMHYDRLARSLVYCILGVNGDDGQAQNNSVLGLDAKLYPSSPVRRAWFYMPLMHSESLTDHDTYYSQSKQLAELVKDDPAAEGYAKFSIEFDRKHRDILEQFGRYPYRNEACGRESTEEEVEWEKAGGDNFGSK